MTKANQLLPGLINYLPDDSADEADEEDDEEEDEVAECAQEKPAAGALTGDSCAPAAATPAPSQNAEGESEKPDGEKPNGGPAATADENSELPAAEAEGCGSGAWEELDAGIPACDPELQARVAQMIDKQTMRGRQLMNELQGNREYRNPRYMQQIVNSFGIQQYGTCFPGRTFDPEGLPAEDFLNNAVRALKEQMLGRKRARGVATARTVLDVATRMQPAARSTTCAAPKRRKWDA